MPNQVRHDIETAYLVKPINPTPGWKGAKRSRREEGLLFFMKTAPTICHTAFANSRREWRRKPEPCKAG